MESAWQKLRSELTRQRSDTVEDHVTQSHYLPGDARVVWVLGNNNTATEHDVLPSSQTRSSPGP